MIQIYKPTNTDFTKNGDMVLFPESCEAHAKLNGEWYMDIEHPLDEEGRWKEIVEEAVISASTFMGKEQLFRIDDMEKTDTEIKAKAYPIFFDSADELFVYSCKPAFKGAQETLNMMMSGSKYSGESDITRTSSAEFINRNLMDCINGDNPAFISYWGGDVLYDNYKVIINERAGANRGLQIRYRKNMESIGCKVDMSNMVTRIVPIAYNGRGISGKYVDSPNVGKYAKVYTRMMEFQNVKLSADLEEGAEPEEGVTVCASQSQLDSVLRNLCNEQFATGIDTPNVTLNVDMVDLSGTEEYKEFKQLEQVSLGDTVGVYHKDLDISTEERCIEITWDCIRNRASKLVLGDYEYDYLVDGNQELRDKMREQYLAAVKEWQERMQEMKDKLAAQKEELEQNISGMEEDISDLQDSDTQLEEDLAGLEEDLYTEVGEVYARIEEVEEEIQGKLDSATGMYVTKQKQSDGSYIYYFHDKSSLNSSTVVWKMTTESIAISTDGGKNYSYGITCDGDAILNRLSLEKLFAQAITATNMTIGGNSQFLSDDGTDSVMIRDGEIWFCKGKPSVSSGGMIVPGTYTSLFSIDKTGINGSYSDLLLHWNGKVQFNGDVDIPNKRFKCLPSYENTCTYLPNTYVGNTGMFTRTTETSSRTLKHDILELGASEELDAKRLYDVDVVQFKYNDGVITDKNDCRYGKDLSGFIIEDLAEKYPIAVDMPSDNVQEWSWNYRYMIPAMLKLIQEQNERIKMLEQNKGGN